MRVTNGACRMYRPGGICDDRRCCSARRLLIPGGVDCGDRSAIAACAASLDTGTDADADTDANADTDADAGADAHKTMTPQQSKSNHPLTHSRTLHPLFDPCRIRAKCRCFQLPTATPSIRFVAIAQRNQH